MSKHYENNLKLNSLKQLPLTVKGLIFERAYYRKDFCVSDLRGLFSGGLILWGGAYYRNWPLFYVSLINKQQISSTIVHIFAFKLEMLDNQLGQLFLYQISSCFHFHFYA